MSGTSSLISGNSMNMTQVGVILGVIGLIAQYANFFPSKDGATGIAGAILVSAGMIAIAIIEASKAN